jgi:hypothetical protein
MNQKSFVVAAILAATALSVIATPLAYAQTTVPSNRRYQCNPYKPICPTKELREW